MTKDEMLTKHMPESGRHALDATEAMKKLRNATTASDLACAIERALVVMSPFYCLTEEENAQRQAMDEEAFAQLGASPCPYMTLEAVAACTQLTMIGMTHDKDAQLDALRAVALALSAALAGHIARYTKHAKRDVSGGVVNANLVNEQLKDWFRQKAAAEWKHSGRNISQMADFLKSGESPSAKTIRKWIGDLCPPHLKKRGRPRNFTT